MKLVYEKLIEQEDLQKATLGSAAFDLRGFTETGKEVSLFPKQSVILNTGIKFDIPEGYVLKVYARSGLGFKKDVTLSNSVGIIDSDFKKEVKLKLVNNGNDVLYIENGMRVAQGILEKLEEYTLEASKVEDTTDRGGFGSTGTGEIASSTKRKNTRKPKKEDKVEKESKGETE